MATSLRSARYLVPLLFLALPGESRSESLIELLFYSTRSGGCFPLVSEAGRDRGQLPYSDALRELGGAGHAWSPDGTRIACAAPYAGTFDIFIMELETETVWNLTNSPDFAELGATWSPDGEQIAFHSSQDGRGDKTTWDIFVMSSYGSDGINLTQNRNSSEEDPAWSPDGRKIAFVSTRDGDYEIYVMDADGGNPINVSNYNPGFDEWPAWRWAEDSTAIEDITWGRVKRE